MKYLYQFSIRLVAHANFNQSMQALFAYLNHQIQMVFIEDEFNKFRSELSKYSIELLLITRVPYHIPEIVD